jgi:signal transduction histidine kinase
VAQAKARGLPVPPELLVEDAVKSQNLVQELGQLLSTMGSSGQAQDTLLDQLLEYSQAQEGGMLATIKHVSDGDVPQ